MATKSPPKPVQSLAEYVMAKKRADCPICKLPDEIRAQRRGAVTKKIRRAEQIEWLAAEHGVKVTVAMFDSHHSGRHEVAP